MSLRRLLTTAIAIALCSAAHCAEASVSAGRIGAQIIIMHRDVDSVVNPVPHLIFHVPDVKTVAMAVLHSSQRTDRVQ